MLRAEGFTISTSTIIDVQKVLATMAIADVEEFEDLKLMLGPFICRNKEEQEKFNKVFTDYEMHVKNSLKGDEEKPAAAVLPPEFSYLKKRKIILLANITSILLVAFLILWFLPGETNDPPLIKISVEGNDDIFVINKPVVVNSYLSDSINAGEYSVNWQVEDSVYKSIDQLKTTFTDSGIKNIVAWLEDKEGTRVSADSSQLYIRCEMPPALSIVKDTIDANPSQNQFSSQLKYTSQITNATADTTINKYQYQWYINDSPGVQQSFFLISFKEAIGKNIKMVVHTNGLHCSTDSLVAMVNELPAYDVAVAALKPLQLIPQIQWSKIILMMLGFLVLPVTVAIIILFLRRKKPKGKSTAVVHNEDQHYSGPYTIEFKQQDKNIIAEKEIGQLAEGMRKRHVTDMLNLDLKKTIRQTIAAAGFPTLSFSPRSQPSDFLAFLDKDLPQAHHVKLFEYLVKQMQVEQVNITSYSFFKEPLLLSNDQLNQRLLPVDKVSRLYPNTILFIFSDGKAFFQSAGTNLKNWVAEKYRPWVHKILFTPNPVNDWDYKEKMLMQAGFTVIPADLNAVHLVKEEINKMIDRQKINKVVIPSNYSARFIDFDNLNQVKNYLGNNSLLIKWICATAVYPVVNWKVTVALGKAIEKHSDNKVPIVTYSNLLKLSRIRWMQTGILKDEMRLEMLKELDNETEVIAREKIIELLDEVSDDIPESSLIKDEYNLNHTVNRFLLHTSNPLQYNISEDEKETMNVMVKQQWLDYPLDKYLSNADNTLLRTGSGGKSISPEDYFNSVDKLENRKQLKQKITRRVLAAAIVLAGLMLLFLFFKQPDRYKTTTRFSDISFAISGPALPTDVASFSSMLVFNDNIFEGERETDTSFIFKKIPVTGAGNVSTLQLNNADGLTVVQKLVTLDSAVYLLTFLPPSPKIPLAVRYNNEAAFQAIRDELTALLSRFDLSPALENFTDSSKITYYNQGQSTMIDSISQLIKLGLNINVNSKLLPSTNTSLSFPVLYLNLNSSCTVMPVNSLPASLTEIWKGETNNRYMVCDLNKKLIYYSTGNKLTYGTYGIVEVCLGNDGIFKFITRAGNQFQIFLLRNIKANSFELAACQQRVNSKEEAINLNISSCDAFNKMTLYFENDPSKIYFNYRSNSFGANQNAKLKKLIGKDNKNVSDYIYDMEPAINSFYNLTTINSNSIKANAGLRNYNIRQAPSSSFKGTPFDRNYIRLREEYSGPGINTTTYDTVTTLIGVVKFDEKYIPEKESMQIIDRANKIIAGNGIIKLVAYLANNADRKVAEVKLNGLKNLLRKGRSAILTEFSVINDNSNNYRQEQNVQQKLPNASVSQSLLNNVAIYEVRINEMKQSVK